jgi:two-component system LytT family response regulator
MIQTVLVDDEIDSIGVLKNMLTAYCPQVNIVGEADGVNTALQLIGASEPDLVFLDIKIVDGNAFDLLNRLQPLSFQVIFVTAFNDQAIRAFKYSAVDYLLKPIDEEDLCRAVEKVEVRSRDNSVIGQLKVLLENIGSSQLSQQKMAIPTMTGLTFVSLRDIIRFEANGSYTTIFLSGAEPILTTRTIKDYETLLPESLFYRVHNSHIVNLQKIQKYQKGRGGEIQMEDNSLIEVAIRRRGEFLARLLK